MSDHRRDKISARDMTITRQPHPNLRSRYDVTCEDEEIYDQRNDSLGIKHICIFCYVIFWLTSAGILAFYFRVF